MRMARSRASRRSSFPKSMAMMSRAPMRCAPGTGAGAGRSAPELLVARLDDAPTVDADLGAVAGDCHRAVRVGVLAIGQELGQLLLEIADLRLALGHLDAQLVLAREPLCLSDAVFHSVLS